MKQTPRAAQADAHRRLVDKLGLHVATGFGQNAELAWAQSMERRWVKKLLLFSVSLEDGLFREVRPRESVLECCTGFDDRRAHVFGFKNEILHLRNMVQKGAILNQLFRLGMFGEEDAVNDV